jgi:hypothetical protein
MAPIHSIESSGFLPRFLLDSDITPYCAESDPDSFFPKDYFEDDSKNGKPAHGAYENERAAKAICAECPLKIECFKYAVETGQHGIWGGTTDNERLAIKRGRGIKLQRSLGFSPTKRA